MGPAELCINVSRRRGLSSCLQKRTSTHRLDCLLPCPFMRTMPILPTLQKKDKRWNVRGLLIRILNILLFIEIDVKLNHGNSCVWLITPLLIGDPMVCGYNCSDDINSTMCDYVTEVTWKITNSSMEHFHDKGLLGWLPG